MNTEEEWGSVFICDYVVKHYIREIQKTRRARERRDQDPEETEFQD